MKQPARDVAPTMALREYQQAMCTEIASNYGAGIMAQMLYAPTGSGKTMTALGLIKRVWISGKVLPHGTRPYFIVDRKTLCAQAVEVFENFGLTVSVIQGENTVIKPDADVVVATTQSLNARHGAQGKGSQRKMRELPRDLGMAIVDEAHLLFSFHVELIERLTATLVVGMSATPLRAGLGKHYRALVRGPSLRDCIESGWLVPPRIFMPSQLDMSTLSTRGGDYLEDEATELMQTITGDIVANWQAVARGRKTLCFCVGVAHAKQVAADFRSEGVRAESIHYRLSDEEADEVKRQFVAGEIDVLCAVMTIATGFDCPAADCAILARPTLSESLHYQQLGRVLRAHPGKQYAIVLDHAGNFARFGDPLEFTVDTLDDGELSKREKQKKLDRVEAVQCLECNAAMFAYQRECSECGAKRERPANVRVIPGQLRPVNLDTPEGAAIAAEYDQSQAPIQVYRELLGLVRELGHKDGRAVYLWRERFKLPDSEWPTGRSDRARHTHAEPSPETRRWYRNHNARRKMAQQAARKKAEALQAESVARAEQAAEHHAIQPSEYRPAH